MKHTTTTIKNMNRKLKFRVWDKEKNTFLINIHNGIDEYGFDLWDWAAQMSTCLIYPDDTYLFQQYTGLKDKNGKEIYEGDIIKGNHDFGPAGFVETTVTVSWDNEIGYQWNYWDLKTIEVIGNIFENPELLK